MSIEINGIRRCLPQRFPFLLVDRVLELVAGERVLATKAVTVNEYCYSRMPETDLLSDYAYPVSLMVEALSQAAGLLLQGTWVRLRSRDHLVMFGAFSGICVHGRAYPGDLLELDARLDTVTEEGAVISGAVLCGERLLLTAERISAAIRPLTILSGR